MRNVMFSKYVGLLVVAPIGSIQNEMYRLDTYAVKHIGWLPLLGGQSVPEGSRNPVVCV